MTSKAQAYMYGLFDLNHVSWTGSNQSGLPVIRWSVSSVCFTSIVLPGGYIYEARFKTGIVDTRQLIDIKQIIMNTPLLKCSLCLFSLRPTICLLWIVISSTDKLLHSGLTFTLSHRTISCC